MLAILFFLFIMIVAYLCGSVCSAVVVSRLFDLPDPRKEGSKNPGATNVLRLSGKKYAGLVLLTDMLKGLIPVVLAAMLGAKPAVIGFAGFAAVMGHMYPIFFGFQGGKGVATALGTFIGLNPMLGAIVITTWLIVAKISHYSSLASIVSVIMAPWYALFIPNGYLVFIPLCFIALFIIYKHANNITRLIDHTEPQIQLNRATPSETLIKEAVETEPTHAEPTEPKKKSTVKKTKKPAPKTKTKT